MRSMVTQTSETRSMVLYEPDGKPYNQVIS